MGDPEDVLIHNSSSSRQGITRP